MAADYSKQQRALDPESEARAIVSDLLREAAWRSHLQRITATLPDEERAVLKKLVRLSRDARAAAAALEAAEWELGQ
jgi:hypothetical protein